MRVRNCAVVENASFLHRLLYLPYEVTHCLHIEIYTASRGFLAIAWLLLISAATAVADWDPYVRPTMMSANSDRICAVYRCLVVPTAKKTFADMKYAAEKMFWCHAMTLKCQSNVISQ